MKNIVAFCILLYSVSGIAQTINKPSSSWYWHNPINPTTTQDQLPVNYNQLPNVAPTKFNYSRTWLPLVPTTNANDPIFQLSPAPSNYKSALISTYTDGFGRHLESVVRRYGKSTPSSYTDLVVFSDLRASNKKISYLPYPTSQSSKFQNNPFSQWVGYYTPDIENGFQYSKSEITPNFVNGLSYPIPTRKDYAAGSSFVGNNKNVRTETFYNDGSESIKNLRVDEFGVIQKIYSTSQSNYDYTSGNLTLITTSGEHGSSNTKYSDKEGKLICYENNPDRTYYAYNDLGQLCYILTPAAIKKISTSPINWDFTHSSVPEILKNLCYRYTYDKYGNVVSKSIPGKKTDDEYIYDSKGNLVFSRSPNMKASNKWSFYVYDDLGREVFNGTYTDAEGLSRVDLLERVNNIGVWPSGVASQPLFNYLWYGYNGTSYPTTISNTEILSYSYYDRYDYSILGSTAPTFDYSYTADYLTAGSDKIEPTPISYVYGYQTATRTKVLDNTGTLPNQWITTVYFYDKHGKTIQEQTLNPWNTSVKDIHTLQYNFDGNIVLDIVDHHYVSSSSKPNTKVLKKYEYDVLGNGVLKSSYCKIDNGPWRDIIIPTEYDDFGRIKSVNYGGVELQEYKYNIRGQLKSINEDHALLGTTIPLKSFGEVLSYDYGFNKPRFDGNLSGIIWRGSGQSDARSYGYEYDTKSRMTHAEFSEYKFPTGPGPMPTWNKSKNDFTVSNLTFDDNGNIASMSQRGVGLVGGTVTPVDIDILSYSYKPNSNQLAAVEDAINKTTNSAYRLGDFINKVSSAEEYDYDDNGNVIKDLNKGITSMSYNNLDLPLSTTITKGAITNTIDNIYSASGLLLRKVIVDNSVTTTYDYWGPFVYKNGTLEYVLHDQGRARYQPTGDFTFDFLIKDSHGNVRNVIESNLVSGVVKQYNATWEMTYAGLEDGIFTNLGTVRDLKPYGLPSDLMSGRLHGAVDSERIGAAIFMHAMAGDELSLKAYGFYESEDTNAYNTYAMPEDVLMSLATTMLSGTSGFNISEGQTVPGIPTGNLNVLLSPGNYTLYDNLKNTITDPNYPRAYLNYLVFNEQMELMPDYCEVVQLKGAQGAWHLLDKGSSKMPINGYVAMFLSNESNLPVWFDNEHITTTVGGLLEEQHYYPHGLTVQGGGQNTTPLLNKYLFESNVLQDEVGLNLYDYNFRQYDYQIGRFTSVDPLADFYGQETQSPYHYVWNNPANFGDPMGLGGGPNEPKPDSEIGEDDVNDPSGSKTILLDYQWYYTYYAWMPWSGGGNGGSSDGGGGGGRNGGSGNTASLILAMDMMANEQYGSHSTQSGQSYGGPVGSQADATMQHKTINVVPLGRPEFKQPDPTYIDIDGNRSEYKSRGDKAYATEMNSYLRWINPVSELKYQEQTGTMTKTSAGVTVLFALPVLSWIRPGFKLTSIALRSALANRIGKRGFTQVGYQFQKHFGRTGAMNGPWAGTMPVGATQNPDAFNKAGYAIFKEIWNAPGVFQKVGNFIEKRLPDGRGIRFQDDWTFKGFID